MPTYSYMNKKTKKQVDLQMTISEMEKFEKKNKHMKRIYTNIRVADPVNIGVSKPSNDFQKHVLGRIKSAVPGASAIGNKRWNIPKEI